jgi:hypothetical protein
MLVCPGCGGRNPPDQDECSFCNRRRASDANGSRVARRGPLIGVLVVLLLLAVAIGVVLLMFSRSAALPV